MEFMRAISILFVVINIYWFCYQSVREWGIDIGVVDRILLLSLIHISLSPWGQACSCRGWRTCFPDGSAPSWSLSGTGSRCARGTDVYKRQELFSGNAVTVRPSLRAGTKFPQSFPSCRTRKPGKWRLPRTCSART